MAVDITVDLDDDQIASVATSAILAMITGEQREAIVERAVRSLLMPDSHSYGNESPLQRAFKLALDRVATKVCEEEIGRSPEIMAHVQELVQGAVKRVLGDEERKAKMIEEIAYKIGDALGGRA